MNGDDGAQAGGRVVVVQDLFVVDRVVRGGGRGAAAPVLEFHLDPAHEPLAGFVRSAEEAAERGEVVVGH